MDFTIVVNLSELRLFVAPTNKPSTPGIAAICEALSRETDPP